MGPAEPTREPSYSAAADAENREHVTKGSEGLGFLEDRKDNPPENQSVPHYALLLAACAALNSTNFGFDIGVSSGVAMLLQSNLHLTDWQVGLFVGSLYLTAALGALSSHAVSDYLGRRWTFIFSQMLFLLGIPMLCLAGSFPLLLLGRVLIGLGVGAGFAIDSLYICEIAPAEHRGRLASWAEIAVNVGILLGFIVNWSFRDLPSSDGLNWRVMMACGAVLPVIITVLALTLMPESPRWLVVRGRMSEAEAILRRTHADGTDIAAVMETIQTQIDADSANAQLSSLTLLRKQPGTMRLALIGIGIGISQQINGSESVVIFSPKIFERAGVAQNSGQLFGITILVGLIKTVFIVIAACYLDSVGRRPLFLISMCGMSVCLFLLAIGIGVELSWLSLMAIFSFIASFSLGVGPVCWLLAAELFPMHIRARAISLATATNRLTSGLVAVTFLPLSGFIGQTAYFTLFGAITAAVALVAWAVVPETRGRALEDVSVVSSASSRFQDQDRDNACCSPSTMIIGVDSRAIDFPDISGRSGSIFHATLCDILDLGAALISLVVIASFRH